MKEKEFFICHLSVHIFHFLIQPTRLQLRVRRASFRLTLLQTDFKDGTQR